MKRDLLLNNPLSSGVNESIIVESLASVKIKVTFKGRITINEMINQCNEYVNSLFMSQLEFQLPLVFSVGMRKRMLKQEPTIGSVSKCLESSQNITPYIVKTIASDKTCSLAFQAIHETCNVSKFKSKIETGKITVSPNMFAVMHS